VVKSLHNRTLISNDSKTIFDVAIAFECHIDMTIHDPVAHTNFICR